MTKKKTNQKFAEYRKKFSPRNSNFNFVPTRNPLGERRFLTSYNGSAFKDLEIYNVETELNELAPNSTRNLINYISAFIRVPIYNLEDLVFRQETISELHKKDDLMKKAVEVKQEGDVVKYSRIYTTDGNFRDQNLQTLENAKNLVYFVDKVKKKISSAKSPFLKDITTFAEKLDKDKRFNVVRDFVKGIYVPSNLGDVIYKVETALYFKNLDDIPTKRKFFENTKIIIESLESLLMEDSQKEFISTIEGKAVHILDSLKERVDFYNNELFRFKGNERAFQEGNNHNFLEMTQYLGNLLREAVDARMPEVHLENLPEELGTYIAAAKLQKKWAERGIPVTRPTLLDKRERKTKITRSYNTTLISSDTKTIPNDIISNPDENLFVVEGPNNGGKTTYIRQVGQIYWVAQLGMWIPAKKAEISVVDGIYTSIGSDDNTKAGTGQYLTELNRVCEFTSPSNGQLHTTPYSLLFFDEFANGTDHEEGVYRTRVVLDHLSMKGVTSYFTTHKHEIGAMIENGEILGGVNLAAEVKKNGQGIETTHRILRGAREGSYGNVIAETKGITPERLRENMTNEIKNGKYDIAHTRMNGRGGRK